jgi:vacuolar-type H+-ATPase catalytic subunit A/Vma1
MPGFQLFYVMLDILKISKRGVVGELVRTVGNSAIVRFLEETIGGE